MAKEPSVSTIKTLFALSRNVCSYEGCETRLTDPSWKHVCAEVAHICGERLGAARYDAAMSDDERSAYDNLILLCPNCHKLIDRLRPDDHSVEMLKDMRERHHAAEDLRASGWATEEMLVGFARAILSDLDDRPRPILLVRRQGVTVEVANVGSSAAHRVRIEVADPRVTAAAISPGTIPAGESWAAATFLPVARINTPSDLRVVWFDETGEQYENSVDLTLLWAATGGM